MKAIEIIRVEKCSSCKNIVRITWSDKHDDYRAGNAHHSTCKKIAPIKGTVNDVRKLVEERAIKAVFSNYKGNKDGKY